jgi:actin-related protein 9
MAQLYAANALSGVVVEIGFSTTDITPIYDGFLVNNAVTSTDIGIKDCQLYLAHLLRSNQSVLSAFSSPPSTSDLISLVSNLQSASLIRIPSSGETVSTSADEGITDIASILVAGREKAVIENAQKKRKASAAEAARAREIEALDLVTVQLNGTEVTLGKERHRFCEPLFDPGLLANLEGAQERSTAMALQDAVGHAVGLTEVDQRQYIWSGLFVTGELANHVKGTCRKINVIIYSLWPSTPLGIPTALQSRLAPYILTAPDYHQANEVQTRAIRPISVPEYFAEYRENGDGLAAFLGSSIVAKVSGIHLTGITKLKILRTDHLQRLPR